MRTKEGAKALVVAGAGGRLVRRRFTRAVREVDRPTTADPELVLRLHVWFSELLDLEIPVIVVVDGPALGAAVACRDPSRDGVKLRLQRRLHIRPVQ